MKLNIQITQENIDKSQRSTKRNCPIALAVKDELVANHGGKPHLVFASIDAAEGRCAMESFGLGDAKGAHTFKLPESAIQFIAQWEAGETIAPFGFHVETLPYKSKSQLTIMRKQFGMIP